MDEAKAIVIDDTPGDTAVDSFLPVNLKFSLMDGKNYLPTRSTRRTIRTPPISTTLTP
jgi:hypothetical protein